MDKHTAKCKKIISRVWGRSHRCSRNAVVGDYCKQHDPDTIKARSDASFAKFKIEFEAKKDLMRLHKAAPAMLEALSMIHDAIRNGDPQDISNVTISFVEPAIALARGEK